MVKLHTAVRFDPEFLKKVDTWADKYQLTRASAIRFLISVGILATRNLQLTEEEIKKCLPD